MTADLASILPNTKFETEKASALVALGFCTIEPVAPQMLEWLQDRNWPVSRVFEPFLAKVGAPLAPYVRAVLAGRDDGWKYSVLQAVVGQSPELANILRPELERLASKPTIGELREEVAQAAAEILETFNGRASVA